MIYSDFIKLYEELSVINESCLTESNAENIDLSKCRVITSDVRDVRGELEASSCLEYNGELTRVQVRTVIIRETENGREFLAKKFRYRTSLPGGGYDQEKDHGDIIASAKREALEEFNFILSNVEDTGVRTWRSREDSWVAQHIKNPEDRWTGYYSYFVVGKVSGNGNNENPEEINKWKWYPIKDLEKVNKEVYAKVISLDEDWGDGQNLMGEQEVTYPDMLSYCCENPSSLALILKSGLIKASSVPETHETDKQPKLPGVRGKLKAAKYTYVSFSKQLYSHAYRRPNKWSFGLAISEKALQAKGYEFTDRGHEYNSLAFEAIYTNDEGNKFMAKTSLYGYVEISAEIYNIIYKTMCSKGADKQLKASDADYVTTKLSRKDAWGVATKEVTPANYSTANTQLKNLNFTRKTSYPGSIRHSMQFVVKIQEFSQEDRDLIMKYLLGNTYYNEGERRVWCKNNEPGVKFSPSDLYGIILPDVIIKDFMEAGKSEQEISEALNLSASQTAALKNIWNYVEQHGLDLLIHSATDEGHLAALDIDRGIKTGGR